MENTIQVGIYHGMCLNAVIEAEPKVAWKAAEAYVRSLAHADGTGDGPGWTLGGTGQPAYVRGIFRASELGASGLRGTNVPFRAPTLREMERPVRTYHRDWL